MVPLWGTRALEQTPTTKQVHERVSVVAWHSAELRMTRPKGRIRNFVEASYAVPARHAPTKVD